MSSSPLKIVRLEPKSESTIAISTRNFNAWIYNKHILNNLTLSIPENKITCIVGPSGSGKSTLLRCLNRINDTIPGMEMNGEIDFHGIAVLDKKTDTVSLRQKVGIVFQKPCIFPKSIVENVVFGIQHIKKMNKREKLEIAEESLRAASLWNEVSHRLNDKGINLSIGQQQRLCIARTLAVKPEVLLLDEPTSSLDHISEKSIEEMVRKLKNKYTIVFVTHNILQAKRLADHIIFICDGRLIEQGSVRQIITNPKNPQTKAYLHEEYCDC